ncbi:MAG: hybrid sensor histidine kinase/response regulator transcription factor [Flectobacillus sp.]|uniref:hybrid sensor histidine kinase/response regulator transcription factor n=1 Tax=Flectobacillus sp. TaxID=50419 RepID=UPI003B9D9B65
MKRTTILIILLWCYHSFAQHSIYNFTSYTTKNGLASNTTYAIHKDRDGFMWFGTDDGLTKFDGQNFKVFRHKDADPTSIGRGSVAAITEDIQGNLWVGICTTLSLYDRSQNRFTNIDFTPYGWIRSLCTDRMGNLWVGTYTGLYYLNTRTKRISAYRKNEKDANALLSDVILCLFEDSKKRIWVGTNAGLHRLKEDRKGFIRFEHNPKNPTSISSSIVRSIAEGTNGEFWFGTDEGLNLMQEENRFMSYQYQSNNPNSLSNNKIYKVIFDRDGMLWVGTDDGANVFDTHTKKAFRITNTIAKNQYYQNDFIGHSVREIYIDSNGLYWLSTLQGGINKYDANLAFFNHKSYNPFDARGLSARSVTSFAQMPNGKIYIGTDGGGLNQYDKKSGFIEHVLPNKLIPSKIIGALEVVGNKLVVGTYGDGMYILDTENNQVKYIKIKANQGADVPVNCLKVDKQGNIWIGTNGEGVFIYETSTNTLRSIKDLYHLSSKVYNFLTNGYTTALEEDTQGNMWIGTNGAGCAIYNFKSHKIEILNHATSNLALDRILSIYCDSQGKVWMGVFGVGLCTFDFQKRKFIQYGEAQLLSNDLVYKILEDEENNLWVSTNQGISKFDPRKKTFKNYNYHNGVQQSTFNMGAGIKTQSGEIYFGGLDGFNYFRPSTLNINNKTPQLILTDLKIGNKSIIPSENAEINKPISIADKITLSYKQNFSLDFVALNYTSPQESQYAYMLEGFDKEWNKAGSVTNAVYTNLDPGKYLFRLKAQSEDGSWQTPERVVEVNVLPPLWKTPIAYFIYFYLVFFILWYLRNRGIKKLKSEFEREKERTENERKIELEKLKIKFLTNLSHELKTPLTLVLNPVESLLNNEKSDKKIQTLNLVNRNAKRLLNLVNQLLDFRSIEDKELQLHLSQGDLIEVAKDIFESFQYLSETKHIQFDFESAVQTYYCAFDKDKVERILMNLLSNAIKFTKAQGSVYFHIEMPENQSGIKLIVGDTGSGFSRDMYEKIFDRFFQIPTDDATLNQGSGIGLSISKEFIKLHGGTIQVESEEGMGSIFTVFLPLKNQESFTKNPIQIPTEVQEYPTEILAVDTQETSVEKSEKPIILVIDDNEDIRYYLKENLAHKYKIVEASDGKQGWQKALSAHPMLIVSDVNMPNMDGLSLLDKIRNDSRTKHIPVILLTVLSEEEQQAKGLSFGANDYLVKPFSFNLLDIKIGNLLKINQTFKETYSKQINVQTPVLEVESQDEKFLLEVARHIEENILQTSLTVEDVSKMVNMSRSTFYNKILALTGETPVEYIRSMRLKKAAYLLEKSDLKIADISFEVGFSNTNYFARAFRNKYQMTPSDYIKLKRHKTVLTVAE